MKTKILTEVSARHIHLCQKDFEKLFGKNEKIAPLKELSQEGEFASDKIVELKNGDRIIRNVRILGPFRKESQAEIALTDAYLLKLKPLPKIKVSGDLANTTKIEVRSKKTAVKIPCIIAQRHIHISEEEAKKLRLKNNQRVSVRVNGIRGITFHDVVVRIAKNYRLALHLDTDEGNAAGIFGKTFGEIIKE